MSITGTPGAVQRRWRRPPPVLPAPTPDEVAAVRARNEARSGKVPRGRRETVLLAVAAVLAVAGYAALFGLDLATDGAVDGSRWGLLLVVAAQWLVLRRRVRYGLGVDEAVRRRLAAPGTVVSPPVPPGPLLSRFEALVAGLGLAVLVTLVAVPAVVAVTRGDLDAWARAGCSGVLALAGVDHARRVARREPVGTSAVLRAVDGALRRRDLLVSLFPVLFLALFGTGGTARLPGPWLDLLPLAGFAVAGLVGVAALLRDDGRLLRDARLETAPPPSVWLAQA